jgi:hypothetical protein
MIRTRNIAAANEVEDIKAIITAINAQNCVGKQITDGFKNKFGIDISAARQRKGSNRGTHYDFEIEVNQEWKKVEHKGGQSYRLPNPDDAPWKAGVQFHNGGCEKYSLARKYARTWYNKYIESGSFKDEFGISVAIPTFDEWFAKDCRTQADPKSAFGKELKSKVRAARGPKASLLDKRAAVIEELEITEEDKRTLITEVLPIANHVLDQKDYWLSIHGDIRGDFHAVWYPQFRIESINSVTIEKKLDIWMTFECQNNFTFNSILRWGKGAGFSCLRLDLR